MNEFLFNPRDLKRFADKLRSLVKNQDEIASIPDPIIVSGFVADCGPEFQSRSKITNVFGEN